MINISPRRDQSWCIGSTIEVRDTMPSSPDSEFMKIHADTTKRGQKGEFWCTLLRELEREAHQLTNSHY